jgi:predicted ABC-type sugar transport system permease subunit
MISDEKKRNAKEMATRELKRYVGIAVYLWALFGVFEVHRLTVLREFNLASVSSYRFGFAVINALILAKVILIGEAFHLGDRFSRQSILYTALFKSVAFAALAICFHFIEGVIEGLVHGKSLVGSIPKIGGGGLEGIVLAGIIASVALLPFFLYLEVKEAFGKENLHSLLLQKRSRSDAA